MTKRFLITLLVVALSMSAAPTVLRARNFRILGIPKVTEIDRNRSRDLYFVADQVRAVERDVGDRRDDRWAADELSQRRFFLGGMPDELEAWQRHA